MRWSAIWQDGLPVLPLPTGLNFARPIPDMTLFLEVVVPAAATGQTIRLWQGMGDTAQAVGVYLLGHGGIRLTHGDVDVQTDPGFARAGETLCLRYRACARGRNDEVTIDNPDRGLKVRLRAAAAQNITLQDALPRDHRFLEVCHIVALAPFGVPQTGFPGLAAGTRIETPSGPRLVETLQKGDSVITETGYPAPIQWANTRPRLCLGRAAPVRLRAPYFGLDTDICVTPKTRILRSGPTVEYIFGVDAVLVHAADLVSGRSALRDRRQAVQVFHHLMLDDHACVMVDRCPVETALLADVVAAEDMAPRPHLAESDANHMVPILDRSSALALVTAAAKGRRALG